MARITVEDCLTKVNNRFSLVMLVSKRSKQIMKGSIPLVHVKDNKAIVTALREVAAGKVWYSVDQTQGSAEEQIQKELGR